ncbi:hypothetical protein M3914_003123 [Vibrio metschnikovii]|nr:hypothetical protein [Vibrio metschnikovii]
MKLSLIEKMTVLFANADQKHDLLVDIAKSLEQDMTIPEIAKDFQTFGSSLEKMVGKRIEVASGRSKPLHSAFEGVVSDISIQVLQSNENDLAAAFYQAADSLKNTEGLFRTLLMAYLVPIAKIYAIVFLMSFIGSLVFAQLIPMLPMSRWPSLSRNFYAFISVFNNHGILILTTTLILMAVIGYALKNLRGSARYFIDSLPFFKQYRLLTASTIMRQLATLINSGKSFLEAVEWAANRHSTYAQWHLKQIAKNIKEAKHSGNIGKILDTGLVDERNVNRLKRIIPVNQLGDRFQNVADSSTLRLERNVKIVNAFSGAAFLVSAYLFMLTFFASVVFLIMEMV